MGARTKARKRALDIVFESELRGLTVGATLGDRQAAAHPPLNPYTVTLVEGVIAHQPTIDELISTHSTGWSLERMPAVDRTVLRLAVFELLYVDEVPSAVAINEAVALVKDLSTDDSPAFVNGVLSRIASVSKVEPPTG
jgi:transcription antitermination protein NusB